MMDYGDSGWWVVMWISMAIFWGLVALGIVALFNGLTDRGDRQESPDETLDRRLASGEIDQALYRVLRDELHRHPQGPAAPAH